jgi:formyltetrahydrofolate synthetase
MSNREKLTQKIKTKYKILAIDLYQQRFKEENSTIYLTAGMNTLLKMIQNFNIYNVPVIFDIKKFNKVLYKQDSKIKSLE